MVSNSVATRFLAKICRISKCTLSITNNTLSKLHIVVKFTKLDVLYGIQKYCE